MAKALGFPLTWSRAISAIGRSITLRYDRVITLFLGTMDGLGTRC
jgi:hypothetical protein